MMEDISQNTLKDFEVQIEQWLDIRLPHHAQRDVQTLDDCALIFVSYYERAAMLMGSDDEKIERLASAYAIVPYNWKDNLYLSPKFWEGLTDILWWCGIKLRPRAL